MSQRSRHSPAARGFSLIELLVVIAILSVIAAIVAPNLLGKADDANVHATKIQLEQITAAIDIAKEIVGNRVVARALAQVALRVRQGEPLSRALTEAAVLPPLTTQLLKVGEETGHLERMLEQLADIYEREVRTDIQRALTLGEPVIILVIAGLITVIILSIVLAVIETNNLAF